MNIRFVDLAAQYKDIKPEIDQAIQRVLDSSQFVLGNELSSLEEEFAAFCGTNYAVGVASGTSALHLSLIALGIQPGDEVLTVPNLHAATAEAIIHAGATPVFVDIDAKTYLMDPSLIEEKITSKTKVIMPVHLFGSACDMDAINAIAKAHNLFVIEDCCQAHGAKYKGKSVGQFSDAAAFSFYPGKNLGAYGDGGIIVTNAEKIADVCKLYRSHGERPKNTHLVVGYCSRLSELQSAIVRVKLRHLPSWNTARQNAAEKYAALLKAPYTSQHISDQCEPVYHLFVIRHSNRDELQSHLAAHGIESGIHYKTPLHLQPAFAYLGYKEGDFPVAEKAMKEIISLPIFPEITDEQIAQVSSLVNSFTNENRLL